MLEGMYAAAAGMEAQQTQLSTISANVANVDTPGYQSEQLGFHDLLYGLSDDAPSNLPVGSGAAASVLGYSQVQGAIKRTDDPLDVAIEGPGYLEIRQNDGTVGLTRNGTLALTAGGQLTTASGAPLVPAITVPAGTQPGAIAVAADGTVSVAGRSLGRLSVVDVPAPDRLVPRGGGVFSASAASGAPVRASATTVRQGALTGSNVDLAGELTTMMGAEQAYAMASKAIALETQMGQIGSSIK